MQTSRDVYLLRMGYTALLLAVCGWFFGTSGTGHHTWQSSLLWGLDGLILNLISDHLEPNDLRLFGGWRKFGIQLVFMMVMCALFPHTPTPIMTGIQLVVIGVLVYRMEESGFFAWKFGKTNDLPKIPFEKAEK